MCGCVYVGVCSQHVYFQSHTVGKPIALPFAAMAPKKRKLAAHPSSELSPSPEIVKHARAKTKGKAKAEAKAKVEPKAQSKGKGKSKGKGRGRSARFEVTDGGENLGSSSSSGPGIEGIQGIEGNTLSSTSGIPEVFQQIPNSNQYSKKPIY